MSANGLHHKGLTKCELYNDNFQNYKAYNIPAKAQLVIADIPYNLGGSAYGSNPMWYVGGDNKNGESDKAGKSFFRTDEKFNIAVASVLKNLPSGNDFEREESVDLKEDKKE